MNLEQLKAMSPDSLYDHWVSGRFPFDCASCGICLTQHRSGYIFGDGCGVHKDLKKQIDGLPIICDNKERFKLELKEKLEPLYALRIFFADAYLEPVPADALPVEKPSDALKAIYQLR